MSYIEGGMNGSYPAYSSRRNVNHRIWVSSLDAGNKVPPGAINDTLRAPKRQ